MIRTATACLACLFARSGLKPWVVGNPEVLSGAALLAYVRFIIDDLKHHDGITILPGLFRREAERVISVKDSYRTNCLDFEGSIVLC
jgi:hypothetical protein